MSSSLQIISTLAIPINNSNCFYIQPTGEQSLRTSGYLPIYYRFTSCWKTFKLKSWFGKLYHTLTTAKWNTWQYNSIIYDIDWITFLKQLLEINYFSISAWNRPSEAFKPTFCTLLQGAPSEHFIVTTE